MVLQAETSPIVSVTIRSFAAVFRDLVIRFPLVSSSEDTKPRFAFF